MSDIRAFIVCSPEIAYEKSYLKANIIAENMKSPTEPYKIWSLCQFNFENFVFDLNKRKGGN